MNRRTFLSTAGSGVAGATAGCAQLASGEPDVSWRYESYGYVGQGFQAAVIILGSLENSGDGAAEEVMLRALVTDANGETLLENRKTYEQLAPDEEQEFWFQFEPSSDQIDAIDDVEVQMRYGGGEWITPSY